MKFLLASTAILTAFLISEVVLADGAGKKVGKSFVTVDKTTIDFTDTLIEGQMKAPEGFFLQGRQAQSLRQMVRLRSKFRNELRNSKSAVQSLVK